MNNLSVKNTEPNDQNKLRMLFLITRKGKNLYLIHIIQFNFKTGKITPALQ